MTREQVRGRLKAIGKRCFVNCFAAASRNDGDLDFKGIIANDPDVGRDESGLTTRKNGIRAIFRDGKECPALRECFTISGNAATAAKARRIYNEYCVGI